MAEDLAKIVGGAVLSLSLLGFGGYCGHKLGEHLCYKDYLAKTDSERLVSREEYDKWHKDGQEQFTVAFFTLMGVTMGFAGILCGGVGYDGEARTGGTP